VPKLVNQCHYYKREAVRAWELLQSAGIEFDGELILSDDGVSVCSVIDGQRTCFQHSFLDLSLLRRARQKNQALIRACLGRKQGECRVVDLTAGWGRDSFILASHGMQVTMIEHNPLVFATVQFLLQIATREDSSQAARAMRLVQADAASWLDRTMQPAVDCLYLDPMFELQRKSAKPGKELQLLQLITRNRAIDEVFQAALHTGTPRVVVKRALHAGNLDERKPDLQYKEKTVRFDVYLNHPG
jgi:16S rRNA (guanine1516-N2)-methyltransferase